MLLEDLAPLGGGADEGIVDGNVTGLFQLADQAFQPDQ